MRLGPDDVLKKKGKENVTTLTCYDYSFAKQIDGLVDIILVGDSLGNVVLGLGSTRGVSLDDMLRHTEAVSRGVKESLLVSDLSYRSYKTCHQAVTNAKRLVTAGAQAVKPEGRPEIVRALSEAGIPVMGHVGLLPQTAKKLGVQGRDRSSAKAIVAQAKEIADAGAFSLVIECVPAQLAKHITETVDVPTIGIGAGPHCDGQVLVLYDMLGLFGDFTPRFVHRYGELGLAVRGAVTHYAKDVRSGRFPGKEHTF